MQRGYEKNKKNRKIKRRKGAKLNEVKVKQKIGIK